jgi:hypothetical protein
MKMSSALHPDDERLSALAAADHDAATDRDLVDHVSSCLRCTEIVDDLRALRTALTELPDLVPSRPLQLVPPVLEPEIAPSRRRWLRRLMAPVAAAGLVVAIVGAAGTAGILGVPAGAPSASDVEASSGGRAADKSPQGESESADLPEVSGRTQAPAFSNRSPTGSSSPDEASAQPHRSTDRAASPRQSPAGELPSSGNGGPPSPWLIVLVAGLAVTGGALAARWMIPAQ